MAEATTFANDYFAQTAKLIEALEALRVLNDRMAQDSGLVTDYVNLPNRRTDVDALAFSNAKDAIVQLLFAYDTGSPPQKAALFHLL